MRAVNPDVTALLVAARAAGAPAFDTLPVDEMRRAYVASRAALQAPFAPVAAVRDLAIPGPGGTLPLRLYRGAPAGPTLPCLVVLHGGGWVLGNIATHEGLCRRFAALGECCVVSVEYRLAPEHPYPAAVEDGAAALRWVVEHAAELGIDAGRIAVGGDSAGGNLAAVLALMGRDGTVPAPCFQLLLYPAVDLRMTGTSYDTVAPGMPLTAAAMRRFVELYAPDVDDWRASPLRAASLAGTAPALVLTCGHDPLCHEGRMYAERLEREGVAVTALHLSDQTHGVLTMDGAVGAVPSVLGYAAAVLRDAWRAA